MASMYEDISAEIGVPAMLDVHGEPALLRPKGEPKKQVRVIVDRAPLSLHSADQNARIDYVFEVKIARADLPQLNVGGDTIEIVKRVTDSFKLNRSTYTITALLEQDGGWWIVGIK